MPIYTKPGQETISKAPPINFFADGSGLASWSVFGAMKQTGTPTPDAPIMPEFVGVRTGQLLEYYMSVSPYIGSTIGSSGGIGGSDQYRVWVAKVTAGDTYTISGQADVYAYYATEPKAGETAAVDGTRHFVSSGSIVTIPSGASCIGVRTKIDEYAMLNTGSTPLPYEPYGYKIPITNAGQTTPVYLGQTQTVRKIRKLVLTGEETTWAEGTTYYTVRIAPEIGFASSKAVCTHAPYDTGVSVNSDGTVLYFRRSVFSDYADIDTFKAYLAQQYAAGHPVTVWYILAEPQTAIVNEPLCKIGDYADELRSTDAAVTIPTAKGANVLTVDTTLPPSSTSITAPDIYHPIDRTPTTAYKQYRKEHPPLNFTATAGNLLSFKIDGNDGGVGDQVEGGYQIPVICNGQTINIPVSAPLTAGQSITAAEAGITIPVISGSNTIDINTTVPPRSVEIAYNTAGTETEIAKVVDNQNGLIYKPKNWFGFTIDTQNDNSSTAVTYTHSAVGMTPAHMDYTNGVFDYGSWADVWFVKDSYPVALNFDGSESYRLDPNDYTKKLDGTPSDIQYVLQTEEPSNWSTQWKQYYTKSGDNYVLNSQAEAPTWAEDTYYTLTCLSSTVNFMIAFPKVYFRRYDDARYNHIEIADRKVGEDWYAYAHTNASGQEVDYIYLPMFKGVIVSSKLRSIPGVIPQGGTTASTEVTAATACGTGWQIWDHSSRELINDLLVLMSKSIDCQGSFGKGKESGYNSADTVTYGKLPTGTLIRKGQFFGYSSSYSEVKVFGIEGFWANRWDRLQGILLDDNVWKIKMTPPYDFTGTDFTTLSRFDVPSENGYLSRVSASRLGSIPASISGGASNKFYKDYFYKTATGVRVGLVGGACSDGSGCGFRYVTVGYTASASTWHRGASPIYK